MSLQPSPSIQFPSVSPLQNGCQPGDKSSSSAPAWLRDFAVRGRNAIRLKEARNNADENQDDNASVAASELTVLLR